MLLWLFLLCSFFQAAAAETDYCKLASDRDSKDLRVFLITLSPGEKLWSSFGHSAIWVSDGQSGKDRIYNFGTFDASQPNLLGRYLNGTLEYWLSVNSYTKDFKRYHDTEGRKFVASRILLPPAKLQELADTLQTLRKPENRSYIYHWSKNSCATKIRDLLNPLTDNQLFTQNQALTDDTYREESLRHLWNQPLVWLGWHYIANGLTDQPLSKWDLMYSPVQFRKLLKESSFTAANGRQIPMVTYECEYPSEYDWAPEQPPDHRFHLLATALSVAFTSMLLGHFGRVRPFARWFFSGMLLLIGSITALLGSVHAALFLSALEGLHPNLNQFLCSPIHWVLVLSGIYAFKEKQMAAYKLSLIISAMAALGLILSLSGVSSQKNIELLCLLVPIYWGLSAGLWLAQRPTHP